MSKAETRTGYEEIAREHALVREVIGKIVQGLDELHRNPALPGTDWKLPGVVGELRRHLRQHFRMEESGGLAGDVGQIQDAHTRHEVDELIGEHAGFEYRLDRLVFELEMSATPAKIVQTCFERDIRLLVQDVREHEHAENELIQRLLNQDAGTGG